MCSGRGDGLLRPPGFPIRKSPDLSLVTDSPGLIAGSYVLLRLLVPRHSPCALINLATTDDARVHCAVLKIRAVPEPHHRKARRFRSDRGDTAWRPFPQDPTACSACAILRIWLSMSTSDCTYQPEQLLRPNSQCSTNELATSERMSEIWLWTNCVKQLASCSLERR
jgi:hypothetical protein